ncbi:MAG: hypothetical protein GC164_15780 [Phycisphaera sp.]|nr:hypothetical protein [Phycisphaera sp.]
MPLMLRPWNNFFHCTGSTYGVWLPGDARGWRSRDHRVHVEGDYKNPPPEGQHAHLHDDVQGRLSDDAVRFTSAQCRVACAAWAEALGHYHTAFIDLAIGPTHWHLLVQWSEGQPKTLVGKLKTWSVKQLRERGHVFEGPVWAAGCRCLPIRDEGHFNNVSAYIARHLHEGAAVWSVISKEN